MAYAAVASLSETIDLILNYHHHSISPQLKNGITSVHENAIFFRSFLEDFPDETNNWEERMREVANKAEDIIELLLSDSWLEWSVGSSTSMLRNDLDELERVTEEMESIAKGVKERHTEPVVDLDEGLLEILDRLTGGPSWLEIIPIVGMGGIGKTTLARNAYNNPLLIEHFDIRGWATVSQNFTMRGLLLSLLNSLGDGQINLLCSKEELLQSVCKTLFGRRYLIVIDDIWSMEAWDNLRFAFPDTDNGSRIILTTRARSVAHGCLGSDRGIHEMRLLNEDQRWNLLRQKIFNRDPCPPKLEYMGKMIARSCTGLPLAIELISGILAADQTQAAWEDIAENVVTAIRREDNEHILCILHLSYAYLPHHLRPCFLYLGMFPEDDKIRVSKLIKLWVAEGFVNESECKSLEETAEEHLVDLVKRRLVSISRRAFDGRMKRVSVHDLVREFCVRHARVDHFFQLVPGDAIKLARRVSIHDFHEKNVFGSTIRTILYFGAGMECSLRDFRLLKILDFSHKNKGIVDLSEQVSELFILRYFAYYYSFSVPAAIPISNLQNLQTLIIRPRIGAKCVVQLPVEIWSMPQLRHVVVHSCVVPIQEEVEAATLALLNLQTLTQAVNLICSRETLKRIPNLKKLCIVYHHLELEDDFQLHNLMYLQKLEILKIKDYSFTKCRGIHHLQKLTLPLSIKELTLAMKGDFDWENVLENIGSLPLLQKLELEYGSFRAGKWEIVQGQFPCLKSLALFDCGDLRYWTAKESSVFPRLEQLRLHYLQQLQEIPFEIGEIPSLKKIELFYCSESAVKCARNIVDEQEKLQGGKLSFHVLVVGEPFIGMTILATPNFQVEVRLESIEVDDY